MKIKMVEIKSPDPVWYNHHFAWKSSETWIPRVTEWLGPYFKPDGLTELRSGGERDLCWDDQDWMDVLAECLREDIEELEETFGEALDYAVLRVFHGCRTEDAGTYFREGLQTHDPKRMKQRLLEIVERSEELEWMKPTLDAVVAKFNNKIDHGWLFVVADDSAMLDHAGHYMIYGSEWITAVLGAWRQVLTRIGAPTLLEIDLPLRSVSLRTRTELASAMFREWTRFACNKPTWSAPIDFSFCLQTDIPASWIVGHRHPEELCDPLEGMRIHKSSSVSCALCRPYFRNAL